MMPLSSGPVTARQNAERVFSGIQPSGVPHIGNYFGAIRNYIALQEGGDAIYCIVDYHALTSTHDARRIRQNTVEMALDLLALGLDPEQGDALPPVGPARARRAGLPHVHGRAGQLGRTDANFKEKRRDQPDDINHALLTYPVLQTADIAIYHASRVPGGARPGRPPRTGTRNRACLEPPLRRVLPRATRCVHRFTGHPGHRRRKQDEQVGRQHDRHIRARS
jgi:hypothetical protein